MIVVSIDVGLHRYLEERRNELGFIGALRMSLTLITFRLEQGKPELNLLVQPKIIIYLKLNTTWNENRFPRFHD